MISRAVVSRVWARVQTRWIRTVSGTGTGWRPARSDSLSPRVRRGQNVTDTRRDVTIATASTSEQRMTLFWPSTPSRLAATCIWETLYTSAIRSDWKSGYSQGGRLWPTSLHRMINAPVESTRRPGQSGDHTEERQTLLLEQLARLVTHRHEGCVVTDEEPPRVFRILHEVDAVGGVVMICQLQRVPFPRRGTPRHPAQNFLILGHA